MANFAQDYSTVAMAPYQATPIAYRQITVTSTAQTLAALLAAATPAYTLTGVERLALVNNGTVAINWTDDGQTPTTTYGQPMIASTSTIPSVLNLATDFTKVKMISTTGNATVNISFYR